MRRNCLKVFTVWGTLAAGLVWAQNSLPEFLELKSVEEVRLTVDPKDWSTLQANYLENTYYPATFTWRGQSWAQVGIRSRGRGTRTPMKPALRVDFSRFVSSQRFQGMKNLAFENLEQDPPMVREFLSMALFRKAGVAAPREVFIHLFVNGQDMGLHLAMEYYDKSFLKRALGEDGGDLYEYSWIDYWNWWPRGGEDLNYAPEPFELKTNEKTAPVSALREMVEALAASDAQSFDASLGERIDIDSLIRYLAVETFIADTDGLRGDVGANNFYIYRRDRDKRFEILSWDKDATFYDYERDLWKGIPESELLRKMLDVPEHRKRYLQVLRELIRSVGPESGWLEQLAAETFAKIRPYAENDPVKRYSRVEFEESVANLQHFLRERPLLLLEMLVAEGQE